MTNKKVIELLRWLEAVKDLRGVNFAKARHRNKSIIKPIADAIINSLQPSPEYLEYDKKRIELCKEYAEKGTDKKPVIKNGLYKIPSPGKNKEFDKAVAALNKQYKEAIDQWNEDRKDYDKLLEAEAEEFTLVKVSDEDVPKNISGDEYDGIFAMIGD